MIRTRTPLAGILVLAVATLPGLWTAATWAQSTRPKYKPLPPPGIEIDPVELDQLTSRVSEIDARIEQTKSAQEQWSPHVEVFTRAVRLAVEQNLFYKPGDVDKAARLLDEAERRLAAVRSGVSGLKLLGFDDADTDRPQTLAGGFRSRIDDSVQPFGVVVPPGTELSSVGRSASRLDVWLHGRGDSKTEVPFLTERMSKTGEYAPQDAFVLHPFGRHCNAFKFAGETDVYEAIEATKRLIAVDEDRISIRGFSMGGAGCWHLGVHDPGRWFAVNPGAGFVDTLVYQGWGDQPPFPLDDVQRKLLTWYDVLPWVGNLQNTNLVAYSGEVDKQKQAADRVMAASKKLGFDWPYVIGQGMGHKIDPPSKLKVEAQLEQWSRSAEDGTDGVLLDLDFTTTTLKYAKVGALTITGLQEHWKPSRVKMIPQFDEDGKPFLQVTTSGVTSFQISLSGGFQDRIQESGLPKQSEPDLGHPVRIDGQTLLWYPWKRMGHSVWGSFVKQDDRWTLVTPSMERPEYPGRKYTGLQGPIDDALTQRFIFVLPSRPAKHGPVERWVQREIAHAQRRWKEIMRGDVRTVLDVDVTDEMIRDSHLICFGDFTSNQIMRKVAPKLPVQWDDRQISCGETTVDASNHVAMFCYPNPLNPRTYLVANSGLTFREFSNNSNSRQIAMLPDWAIGKVDVEDDSMFSTQIIAKGFFGESWE